MSLEPLFLSQIRTDGGTQPRGALDEDVIVDYSQAMLRMDPFPPLKVVYDGESYWLYDGFHRLQAAQEAALERFQCEVLQGTVQDAQWMSFSANQSHGLRRTNADKRRAVEAALRHERGQAMSDHAVAEHCGVSQPFVGSVRRDLTNNGFQSNQVQIEQGTDAAALRTGRDGRTINVGNIGAKAESGPAWPLAIDGYYPKDGEPCFFEGDSKLRAWVKIYALQVGLEEWVACCDFDTPGPFGKFEPMYSYPVHPTGEDAVADAAFRAGVHIDSTVEGLMGHRLDRQSKEWRALRFVRMVLADQAGQMVDDPWVEPASDGAMAQLTRKTEKAVRERDARIDLALESARMVGMLAETRDWKALGMLLPDAVDGANLAGQIGFARRNLAAFLKGVEAR